MSLFHVISVAIPILGIVILPRLLPRHTEPRYRWLLYVAGLLFFVAWYLPSPLIDGQDTSLVTHFVGGGVYTGLIWMYLKQSLQLKSHWLLEAFSLFGLVSVLGCVNELAELLMVRTGIAKILLSDTNWDILANTIGAFVVFGSYSMFKILNSRFQPHDRRR